MKRCWCASGVGGVSVAFLVCWQVENEKVPAGMRKVGKCGI